MHYQEKLQAIRLAMRDRQIDAYIIPAADPHMSEYVPDYYKCILFASGFSGSAGTLVITQQFAGLWADSRYFEQAQSQLMDSGYQLVKLRVPHTPEYIDWLNEQLPEGAVIGFDFSLLSIQIAEQLKDTVSGKAITLKNADLIAPIWHNRPALPTNKAYLLPDADCGATVGEKLKVLRAAMHKQNTDWHLISTLDDIAWLFNIRGSDVSFNPVVLSFVLIGQNTATLYISAGKLDATAISTLQNHGVKTTEYHNIETDIQNIKAHSTILLDEKRTCYQFASLITENVRIIKASNPTVLMKAIKNEVEIANMRSALLKDGVALTRFFKWLEENVATGNVSELAAAEKLSAYREANAGFAGLSFGTIAGYQAHAALPHYNADANSNVFLKPKGLLLLDSGAHYHYGTTDVTRTIPLGQNTDEERQDYTLVLSAMLAGSMAKFPLGTRGYQIDAICRQQLWAFGINYGHGTGHGVGHFLNVHEGPQNIGPANTPVAMEAGMITSMEPGIYRPGKHGVRIENLILTVEADSTEFGDFLKFETLTLAHIDTSLIMPNLLTPAQINWLNEYHQVVYDKLSPLLNADEVEWLRNKCQPV